MRLVSFLCVMRVSGHYRHRFIVCCVMLSAKADERQRAKNHLLSKYPPPWSVPCDVKDTVKPSGDGELPRTQAPISARFTSRVAPLHIPRLADSLDFELQIYIQRPKTLRQRFEPLYHGRCTSPLLRGVPVRRVFRQGSARYVPTAVFVSFTLKRVISAILNRVTLHSESAHPMQAREIVFEPFDASHQRETGSEPVLLRAKKELLEPNPKWYVQYGSAVPNVSLCMLRRQGSILVPQA